MENTKCSIQSDHQIAAKAQKISTGADNDGEIDSVDGLCRYIFVTLPIAQDIDEIAPILQFYRQNDHQKSANYPTDERKLIGELSDENYLSVDRIIFITHGFLASHESKWLDHLKDELLRECDQLIVKVGWGNGAGVSYNSFYPQAASNAIEVGKWLAKYIVELKTRFKHLHIYCVGHSLGAHIFGSAGRHAMELTVSDQPIVDRITGLDPAGEVFENDVNSDKRLRRTDAKFVDVIHTDGWGYVYYFGTLLPMGCIDFYPNYGYQQNYSETLNQEEKCRNLTALGGMGYSHSRCIDFFIWSINNKDEFKTDKVLVEEPAVQKINPETKPSDYMMQMGYHSDRYVDHLDKLDDKRWFIVDIDKPIPQFIE